MTIAGERLPAAPNAVRLAQSVAEARRLLAALDSTRPQDMGPVFYAHAYGELDLALCGLLDQLDPDADGHKIGAQTVDRADSDAATDPGGAGA